MVPRRLDEFSNSRMGLSLAAGVGRATPPAIGRRVASRTADLIASRRDSGLVRAIRSNQWVVSGGAARGADLDAAVRETLRHIARCTYDLYHSSEGSDGLLSGVSATDGVRVWLNRIQRGDAAVFAVVHLSNFDLGGRALARLGLRAQVLSVPDPTDAYRVQNELRREVGLDMTPISSDALRAAYRRLEGGGAVLTGIDRPLPQASRAYEFFGRPALLPDVHVRLATRADVPLVLMWLIMEPSGEYVVDCVEIPLGDGRGVEAYRRGVQAVLGRAAEVIAAHPTQWAMPHPVWPGAVTELERLERREG